MIQLLNDCSSIERLAGEIYSLLSREGSYCERVRATFRQLASDEVEHARQLELAIRGCSRDGSAVKRISWTVVDALLGQVLDWRNQVQKSPPTEEEALRLALELERNLVRIHVDHAIHFDDPRIFKLFQGLGRSDEEHLGTLRNCLEWWHRQKGPGS